MKLLPRFFLIAIVLFTQKIYSQNLADQPKQTTTWDMFKYDMGTMFSSVGHTFSSPFRWKGKQFAQFGGVVAGTGFIFLFDEQTSEFGINQRSSIPSIIRNYGKSYSSPENNYMATGAVYLTGLFTKNEKLRRTGVLLVASTTSTGLIQQLLKPVVGRARPTQNLGKATFDPFNSSRDYYSFPSGHAMLAFTNAYAISKQFKNPWVKAGIYTLGAIPGFSRLWDGQHWLSDVAFSFIVSIVTVESIDRYLDKKYNEKYNDQQKAVSWNLNFGPGTIGLSIGF